MDQVPKHDPCKSSDQYVVRSELEAYMDREIRHLRDLVDRITLEKTRALELQGVEYARRLEELNNAHERAEKAVSATVPRERYENFLIGYNEWKDEVSKSIAKAQGVTNANARFFAIVVSITGLIFSLVTIWMKKG